MLTLDFIEFNMIKSLKQLQFIWKTLDKEKIETLLNYSIVHEVMKVEERKAVRRLNKGNVNIWTYNLLFDFRKRS